MSQRFATFALMLPAGVAAATPSAGMSRRVHNWHSNGAAIAT